MFSSAPRVRRAFGIARSAHRVLSRARTISFSQYGEDVLLYNLVPAARGTYVDVGAFHPWQHSNTYKLYLRGWRGLTIEPNPDVASVFRRTRPRDTHLVSGIWPSAAELTYYRYENPANNSFDRDHARRIGERVIDEVSVPCVPLQEAIDTHPPGHHVDLLSVDCEGLDLEVLRSLDWRRSRPTAVIVEDFEQFERNYRCGETSSVRSFLAARDYVLFSQCLFSFLYVDRTAFRRPPGDTGFNLAEAQFGAGTASVALQDVTA